MMIRIIFLLVVITLLSIGASWLGDEPGHVVIDWSTYHIEASLLVVLACIAVLSLACVIAYLLLFAILRSPRTWRQSRKVKRQSLGLSALTEAFAAIATQDIRTARKQMAKAQHYLPDQPLTLMLAAQAARMEGNESKARLYLEKMLSADGAEFMATRGLIENARRNNDDAAAMAYAEKALAMKPGDAWTVTTLIGLYTQAGRLDQALQLAAASARRRTVSKTEGRRLRAFVLYERAIALIAGQRTEAAIAALLESLDGFPGFAPAAALLATTYLKEKQPKSALKIITSTWKGAPHRLLTGALLACWDQGSDAEQKKIPKVAAKLAQMHSEHKESQFLLAEMALRQLDRDSARGYIQHLLGTHPTMRACTLMAELEQSEGRSEEAAQWLKRAGNASHDGAAFTCSICHHGDEVWHLTCPQCGAVGAIG